MRQIFLVLALSLCCLNSFCQEIVWTIDACIDYALNNNISIKNLNNKESLVKTSILEARSEFLPTITAGVNYNLSSGRVLDQTTYNYIDHSTIGNSNISITGSEILFSGLERYYRIKLTRKEYDAFVMDKLAQRKNICRNVVSAYYNVLCADKNIETAQVVERLIEEQLSVIETQVDAGMKTEADLLQIKSQLCSAQNDIVFANNMKKMALLELGQLMDIADYASMRLHEDGEIDIQQIHNVDDDIINFLLHHFPECRAEKLRVESAQYAVKVAKSSYYPTLSLSGSYGSNYSSARQKKLSLENNINQNIKYPPIEQWVDNSNAYISLTLQIPIFNGMRVKNSVRRAEVAVRDAYYTMSLVEMQLTKEFEQIRNDYEAAYQRYESASEQLKYTYEVLRQIKDQYECGKCDYLTWSNALVEYAKAQYEANNTKYTLISTNKLLQTYYDIN